MTGESVELTLQQLQICYSRVSGSLPRVEHTAQAMLRTRLVLKLGKG